MVRPSLALGFPHGRRRAPVTRIRMPRVVLPTRSRGARRSAASTSEAPTKTAKKSDVDALTKKVDALQSAVTKNSKDTQNTLNSTVTGLQQQIAAVQKQRAQDAANIAALQSEIASGGLKKGAGAVTPTTTTTP